MKVMVRADPDESDCLTAAAEEYISNHPEVYGWDLDPQWYDDNDRTTVVLTVPLHEKDEDCTVVDGECVECGVTHPSESCPECGRHGFHTPECIDNDEGTAHDRMRRECRE